MNKGARGFERVLSPFRRQAEEVNISLPLRATSHSAGYDFFSPIDLEIPPQTTIRFFTDIKVYMQPDEMLMLLPRSSVGSKLDLMISNTVGIGDSDFYENPENDGNYSIGLRNLKPAFRLLGYEALRLEDGRELQLPLIEDLGEKNTVRIQAGERVVQGIFVKVLSAQNGNTDTKRQGGLGSTGK